MPTVRLNDGDIVAEGSLTALHITTRDVSTETINVTGQLTASGDIAANKILGNVHVTGTAYASDIQADTLSVSHIQGLTNIEGNVQASTIEATAITGLTTVNGDLVLTGSLTANTVTTDKVSFINNLTADDISVGGDISTGTLGASYVHALNYVTTGTLHTSGVYGLCKVDGTVTADDLHVASGVTALTVDCDTLNVEQTVSTTEMHAMTANITDTLTVGGDLIIEGDDDKVLGDTITDVTGTGPITLNMRHNHWYRTGYGSYISILADTDSGRIKTCYIISSPANPLVLNGVTWLWEPVELEDTSKTHVIALQQIGAGPVMANVAYSY